MKKNGFLFVLGILIPFSGFSQKLDTAKLDSLFAVLETNNRFMGSVALTQGKDLLYHKAIGYANVANQKRPTADTKYRMGSITKMFTSVLVFKAVEAGLLSLDKTLDAYFPEIENSRRITLGNLLNHRSGIHNFTSRPDYPAWDSQPKTREQLLEIIREGGSVFEPDSQAQYSNSNYVLLTFILEDAFKEPYAQLVREKITEPLGLKNTRIGGTIKVRQNDAYSYSYQDSWKKMKETHMSIPLGAGALVATPSDLNRFIYGLFNEGLISAKSLNQMKTLSDGYGMGIFPVPYYDKKGFGHNGGIDGFTSVLGYLPEDSLAVALVSNGTRYPNNDIVSALLSAYYGKPFEIPSFATIAVSSEDLDPYLGLYASEQLPLKITISKDGDTLFGQATGQASFPLESVETHVFEFGQAGIRLEFDPVEKTMVLKQGGGVFQYVME
ncbi:MAG: serine hydrolase domain-containing protein [Bacteroidota bacterium]